MSGSTSRLRTAIEHVRREPGFGRNVVMVAVVVAMGLAVGSFILGKQQYTPPWADETLVWATFDETVGVAEGTGQEVRISGVPVGEIREAEIDDKGDALLLLAIKRDVYDKPIYSDATMVLRPKSPLNEMYVEINPGTPAAEPVAPEGVLPVANTRSPIQIDQPLSHLDEQSLEGLESLLAAADQALARAPQDLPAGLDATTAVLNDLRPVVEELDERRENIKTLVTALGQVSQAFGKNDERLASLTDGMHKTLRSMAGEGDSLRSALAWSDGRPRPLERLGPAAHRAAGPDPGQGPRGERRDARGAVPGDRDDRAAGQGAGQGRAGRQEASWRGGGPASLRGPPEPGAGRPHPDRAAAPPHHRWGRAVPARREGVHLPDELADEPA